MNATTDNRSAADLEREGEEIRADLDRTLDEIERKLSPGELLDQSMEFLRNNGAEFLREAGETVRRNPVPVLLTAAGLIWLTSSVVKSRSSSGRSEEEEQDFSGFTDSDEDYLVREDSSGSYSRRGHNGGSRRGHNGGSRDIGQAARGKARRAAEKVKGRLSESMHAMQDRTQDMGSQLVRLVQEQPIALGALALAAGALLGAALPMTQYENRLVGPVHDRTMARAKELGQREYEHLRDTVTSSIGGSEESRETRSTSGPDQPEQG